MRYLVLSILILSGCKNGNILPKDPHWRYGQHVKYEVPEFFRSICNGRGIVIGKYFGMGEVIYHVEPESSDSEFKCFNANKYFPQSFKID